MQCQRFKALYSIKRRKLELQTFKSENINRQKPLANPVKIFP